MTVMRDIRLLARAFVGLADSLVDDFDVIDLLLELTHECVRTLGVDAAGVMLSDNRGHLRVAAASSERARLLELFELQNDEGPCLDCFRDGTPVASSNLGDASAPWPHFAPEAVKAGFQSAHALPMRLRKQVIGALNLFWTKPVELADEDVRVAQAFADIATIAILQERQFREQVRVADQLQAALESRIVIEQAKGVIAERDAIDMEAAFAKLRAAARNHNRRLSDLAREVVTSRGLLDLT
jgi:GAF domain-containing protein